MPQATAKVKSSNKQDLLQYTSPKHSDEALLASPAPVPSTPLLDMTDISILLAEPNISTVGSCSRYNLPQSSLMKTYMLLKRSCALIYFALRSQTYMSCVVLLSTESSNVRRNLRQCVVACCRSTRSVAEAWD